MKRDGTLATTSFSEGVKVARRLNGPSHTSVSNTPKINPVQIASLILLSAVAVTMLFWRLGEASLNDWDEAIYAQISKEIVTGGDWITLHWGYENWFHKPPLFMWVTATFFKFFGVSEFWARVPSALSGLGLLACSYLIARKLYDHGVGLLAVAVLLTNYTFMHFSRFGTTDIALTLFSYLAIYAYLWVYEGKRWAWCGVWAAIALAVMTKGVAGLAVAIALTLTLLFTGRIIAALRCRAFWVGLGLAGAIVIPWHWAMIVIHGQAFIDQYFLYHVVERSTGGIEGNEGGPLYYFAALGRNFFPWVYLLPLAVFQQINQQVRGIRRQEMSALLLLVFVLVVFGGFSLASTKLKWYIIPIYPALAIWIGALLRPALDSKDRRVGVGLLVSGAVVMALFPSRIVFLSDVLEPLMVAIGLAALMVLSVAVYKFGWRRQILNVALCGLFLVAGVREIKGIYQGYERPVETLSHAAEVPVSDQMPPLLVAKLSQRLYMPAPMFYSNRPIAWVRSPDDLANATDTERKQDILLATEDVQQLQSSYDIDVYAKKGKLTYAGIRRRDRTPASTDDR
ncbi:MAG: glycosyltransferase family 39 protein [Phormidesmis sp.]